MSDHYFDGQGFVYPCAPTSAPPSLNSSSMEAPSAVHHDVRMNSRRLPVIPFVSRIEFLIMIMLYVARCACCGRRRLFNCMREIACLPLRLIHSLLLLLLLLLPPPCSIRTVWLLSAPSDPSTRNRHLPVKVVDLAAFIPWQLVALQACVFLAFPSSGYQSGSARVGRPWPPTWLNCWLSPHVSGSGWSGQVSCGPFCRPLVRALGLRLLSSQAARHLPAL